jgi:hypothetical protein
MIQTSPLHAYHVIGVALSRDALWGHVVQRLEDDMVSPILYLVVAGCQWRSKGTSPKARSHDVGYTPTHYLDRWVHCESYNGLGLKGQ